MDGSAVFVSRGVWYGYPYFSWYHPDQDKKATVSKGAVAFFLYPLTGISGRNIPPNKGLGQFFHKFYSLEKIFY